MLIVVDPQSGVPVYRQLMEQIRFQVAAGVLAPGEELPSTRSLSAELGVNPMTISKAYGFLEMENVIERRPGRPVVVADQGDAERATRKRDELRKSLARAATVARQLGIAEEEAVRIFEDVLGEAAAGSAGGSETRTNDLDERPEGDQS